jgi:hypothetical protein
MLLPRNKLLSQVASRSSRWTLSASPLACGPRWLSTVPSADSSKEDNGKYMYGFGIALVAANVFTIWQEMDAHDDEADQLKHDRQMAWEKEQNDLTNSKR